MDLLILGGILLVGLLLRGLYLRENARKPEFSAPAVDAAFHDYWARAMVTGDWTPPVGEGDPQTRTTPYLRPPGYPYFLALVYKIAGLSYLAPRIVQMCLGLVNSMLAFLIGRRWYGRGVGLVWAAFMSVYWVFIYFEGEFHALTLLISLLLSAVGFLGLWAERTVIRWGLAAGITLGLASLVRPNVLLFLPVVLLWACWVAHRRRNRTAFYRLLPGFVGGAAVVIAPATIRNYQVANEFVLISSNVGINLLIGNNENANGTVTRKIAGLGKFGTCFDYPTLVTNLEKKLQRSLTHREVSAYFTKEALRFTGEHPFDFIRLTAKKVLLFWGPDELAHNRVIAYERKFSRVLSSIPGSFAVVLSSGLVGMIMLVRESRPRRFASGASSAPLQRRWELSLLILLLIFIFFLSVLPFFIAARYRVPIIPFLLLFGAYGLCRVVGHIRTRDLRSAAVWVIVWTGLLLPASRSFVHIPPDLGMWYCGRGIAHLQRGELDSAIEEFREALVVKPDLALAHIQLATVLTQQGNFEEANRHYAAALRLDPDEARLHSNYGSTLARSGKLAQAIEHYTKALQLKPDLVEARYSLANALLEEGRIDDAVEHLTEAVRLRPEALDARLQLGIVLAQQGKLDQALEQYRETLRSKPDSLRALSATARILLTHENAERRDAAEAIRLATRACELTAYQQAELLDTLAAGYAEARMFSEAVVTAQKAVERALATEQDELARSIGRRLERYRAGQSAWGLRQSTTQPNP